MNKAESQKLTDEYLMFAEDEERVGTISSGALARIHLQIAAEYLLYYNSEEKCMVTINKVPESYFIEHLANDMAADSIFAKQMLELSHHLELRGSTFAFTITTTQHPAEA